MAIAVDVGAAGLRARKWARVNHAHLSSDLTSDRTQPEGSLSHVSGSLLAARCALVECKRAPERAELLARTGVASSSREINDDR